jgi:hypothetical protein
MTWLTIFTIICAVLSSFIIADDSCRFQDPLNGVIDLSSLAATDGRAAYPDTLPKKISNYSKLISHCLIIYY